MATADIAQLIPVSEAPHYLKPKRGRHLHPDTVRLWCTRGFMCGTKLPRHRIAARWLIDLEELREFVRKTGCAEMRD
jgi:hypothetical protein